ncbi:hypothetical protein QBC44DRAFT_378709 [Cladorrhinum sp. PSN332]|nr:hypothetical protein QBC44DRAFT_378709 [Cladorrhinum sp. PSN332]
MYSYQPLPHDHAIRVLQILPDAAQQPTARLSLELKTRRPELLDRGNPITEAQRHWITLSKTVQILRQYGFTGKRDHIHGCLGFTSPTQNRIVPDYQSTTVQVNTHFARSVLEQTPHLDLLNTVEDPSQRTLPGLPSWVPNFSITALLSDYFGLLDRRNRFNSTASGLASSNSASRHFLSYF